MIPIAGGKSAEMIITQRLSREETRRLDRSKRRSAIREQRRADAEERDRVFVSGLARRADRQIQRTWAALSRRIPAFDGHDHLVEIATGDIAEHYDIVLPDEMGPDVGVQRKFGEPKLELVAIWEFARIEGMTIGLCRYGLVYRSHRIYTNQYGWVPVYGPSEEALDWRITPIHAILEDRSMHNPVIQARVGRAIMSELRLLARPRPPAQVIAAYKALRTAWYTLIDG